MNDLEWQEEQYSKHYAGWSKRLSSPAMNRDRGRISKSLFTGVVQQTWLELTDSKIYNNGFMLLHYRVKHDYSRLQLSEP